MLSGIEKKYARAYGSVGDDIPSGNFVNGARNTANNELYITLHRTACIKFGKKKKKDHI